MRMVDEKGAGSGGDDGQEGDLTLKRSLGRHSSFFFHTRPLLCLWFFS